MEGVKDGFGEAKPSLVVSGSAVAAELFLSPIWCCWSSVMQTLKNLVLFTLYCDTSNAELEMDSLGLPKVNIET